MAKTDLPWLAFTGQSTDELLACAAAHRVASLVSAFGQGIEARLTAEGESSLSEEERLVLAVEALQLEVNNGGYHQFFFNSSRRYAPMIAGCLRKIGCTEAARITEKALAAAGDREVDVEDSARDSVLDECDREFYRLRDIETNLFRFIQENRKRIRTGTPARVLPVPKSGQAKPATKLWVRLLLGKTTEIDLGGARKLARELAHQESLPVSEQELEAAAVLYAFRGALKRRDVPAAAAMADLAHERSWDHPSHAGFHRNWVELLLAEGRADEADEQTVRYLTVLSAHDQTTLATQNKVLYWSDLLRMSRAELPRSVAFFKSAFPEDDLDGPLPGMRFTPAPRPGR